jgi:uroporphyrinogen decarboxylase
MRMAVNTPCEEVHNIHPGHQTIYYDKERDMSGKRRRKGTPMMGLVSARLSNTTIKENLLSGEAQFRTISNLVDTYNIKTVPCPFVDNTVLPETLGCEIFFQDNAAASVKTHPVKTREDLAALTLPDPHKDGRLPEHLKAVKLICEHYPDRPKSGSITGPFTLAIHLGGLEDVLMKTYDDPQFVEDLVDFSTRVTIEWARAQLELGCSSAFIGDPAASLLDPAAYAKYAAAPVKRLVEELQVPMMLHICGDSTQLIEEMCATGVSGISVDAAVDIKSIVDKVPQNVLILGNLNPVGTVMNGTPQEVVEETKELLDRLSDVPNWRFCTGCDLPPDTPLENINAMMEVLENY